ncbi:hypothetical protein OIV83_004347 [Microbotryomycetes sp. JL201]|nr:hypothetical protein OIV83_004278 [Microbotryomycetes sp. JL201]KAK4049198.1 hypothetical protein OIV83_004347 [Microbotryomycetes sp. JL201]
MSSGVPYAVYQAPKRPPRAHIEQPAAPAPASLVMAVTPSNRARALAKVTRAAQSTSEIVGPKLDSAKARLHEWKDRQQQQQPNSARLRSATPSRQSSWSSLFAAQNGTADPRRRSDFADPTRLASTSARADNANTARTNSRSDSTGTSKWAGWSNYFSSNSARKESVNTWGEEKLVAFPGWATLCPSKHATTEPALVLHVLAHGYAYRLRPLDQASRSQRIFYSLAKSFASLPRVPAHLLNSDAAKEEALADEEAESLEASKEEALLNGNVFEQLLEIGGRDGEAPEKQELARATALASEPEEMSEAEMLARPQAGSTKREKSPLARSAAANRQRPHVDTNLIGPNGKSDPNRRNATAPVSSSQPQHASSMPSSQSTSRAASPSPVPTNFASPVGDEWPKPFSFAEEDLPRLHRTLQSRLLPFWGFKLTSRKIRLSVYPVMPDGVSRPLPIATKVVTTSNGGGFRSKIEISSNELRRLLDETGQGVELLLDHLQVRVVAELLEQESALDELLPTRDGAKVAACDETDLKVAQDGGVRVISDIDDTIKWTQVLHGTKTIFRNVFVREVGEVVVPGMASWYEHMRAAGAHFHYVSNSPWELWPVIRDFIEHSFPSGSVTLKEYGGAGSAIAKLWEDPGNRKRAGVESIIKEFPHSRFILVGDSGEQDLALYVSLAAEYPDNVLAVYIRDVTTPFHPNAHPDLDRDSAHTASSMGSSKSSPAPSRSSTLDTRSSASSRLAASFRRGTTLSSSTSSTTSTPSSPILFDQDADALSPNNSFRPGTLRPTQSEQEAALVEQFYQRVLEAEKVLPRHVPLRLFRHGAECTEEATGIVKRALGWSA